MTLTIDTREPDPHPWARFWPAAVSLPRATLDTGDVCLAGNADVAIERKTPEDLVACLGGERERFERELRRATHLASFAVVVSGSLGDVLLRRRGLHPNAIIGTLAAWARRYRHPFVFAGSDALAADFALRFLAQPFRATVQPRSELIAAEVTT